MAHIVRLLAALTLGALAAAAPAGDDAVPTAYREEIRAVLRRALEEGDPGVAAAAAAGLARTGDGAAAPALLHLLRTGDVASRRSAAAGLADLGDRSALPALLAALDRDADPAVRGAAAVAAARLGGRDAADPIRAAFDRSPGRPGLAEALALLGDVRDVDRISLLLYDRTAPLPSRAAAAAALARFVDPHAVLSLVDALHDDPSAEVRRAAALALAGLAGPVTPADGDGEIPGAAAPERGQ